MSDQYHEGNEILRHQSELMDEAVKMLARIVNLLEVQVLIDGHRLRREINMGLNDLRSHPTYGDVFRRLEQIRSRFGPSGEEKAGG